MKKTVNCLWSASLLLVLAGCSGVSLKSNEPGPSRNVAASSDVSVTASSVEDQVSYRSKRDSCLKVGAAIASHTVLDDNAISKGELDCWSAAGAACTLWNITMAGGSQAIDGRHASNLCYLISAYKVQKAMNGGQADARCERSYNTAMSRGYAADDNNNGCRLDAFCDQKQSDYSFAGQEKSQRVCDIAAWAKRLDLIRSMTTNFKDLP